MPRARPDGPGSFEAIIEPWLDLPGVTAAVLASTDGLLIAAAGRHGRETEALAADCASVLAAAGGLFSEAGQARPRLIAIETAGRGVILAPLGRELFLIITGQAAILRLAGDRDLYRLALRSS